MINSITKSKFTVPVNKIGPTAISCYFFNGTNSNSLLSRSSLQVGSNDGAEGEREHQLR